MNRELHPSVAHSRAVAKSVDTRLALMRAAEESFAERGIHSVSLREITLAAGQRNLSAAIYHFHDKTELLECVLERHAEPMQKSFLRTLEELERTKRATLRNVVTMLVKGLAAKLDDPDGGRHYLALIAQLAASAEYPLTERRCTHSPGNLALMQKLVSFAGDLPPQLFPIRLARFTNIMSLSFVDYMRLSKAGAHVPRDMFIEELIDALMNTVSNERQRREDAVGEKKHQRAEKLKAKRKVKRA